MKRIPLTQGEFALVDDEDYPKVSRYKWYLNKQGNLKYAHRQYRDPSIKNSKGDSKQIMMSMHRFIMNAQKGQEIDHRNHNGLDNTKANLRLCTHSQNLHNQRPTKKESRFKGVTRHKDKKKWRVSIMANGVKYNLGCYSNQYIAAKEYDKLATILHGEYALLNFPKS